MLEIIFTINIEKLHFECSLDEFDDLVEKLTRHEIVAIRTRDYQGFCFRSKDVEFMHYIPKA